MTTWVDGNTLTAAWMNSVEQVLALGTYAAATTPRLTLAPNSTYDLAGGFVAGNLIYNGSATVSGAGKQYEGLSFRTLTSTNTGAAAYSTCISIFHNATLSSGAFAYNYIGTLTAANAAAAGNKFSGLYQRVATGSTANGATFVAGSFSITHDTGSTVDGTSSILNLTLDGTNAGSFPIGMYWYSNNPGKILNNGIVVDSSLFIGASLLQWNQRAGQVGGFFLKEYDSTSSSLFDVDYLGNINFATTNHKITSGGVDSILFKTNGDMLFGKGSAATADTTGHHYIQAVAGAPSGVPTGYSGYVPMRYDSTNNFLYIYNGGWKKSTVYA